MKVDSLRLFNFFSFLSAILLIVLSFFPQFIYPLLHIPQTKNFFTQTSGYYAGFSGIFLANWLRMNRNILHVSSVQDTARLLSTAGYIIVFLVPIVAIPIISHIGPGLKFADAVFFVHAFLLFGLSLCTSINHSAQIVTTLSARRTYVYLFFIVMLAFLAAPYATEQFSLYGLDLQLLRFIIFLLLYALVYIKI
jgi:hypothetical protein